MQRVSKSSNSTLSKIFSSFFSMFQSWKKKKEKMLNIAVRTISSAMRYSVRMPKRLEFGTDSRWVDRERSASVSVHPTRNNRFGLFTSPRFNLSMYLEKYIARAHPPPLPSPSFAPLFPDLSALRNACESSVEISR